jgi:hypothetical protein
LNTGALRVASGVENRKAERGRGAGKLKRGAKDRERELETGNRKLETYFLVNITLIIRPTMFGQKKPPVESLRRII